ncbi:hypothetical protein [Flavobacterium sp.]|uniref:hypothetical protein n=1 Tax=Flavobacterium sp. TaxID=239 RepID=UPI00260837C7|nr:hypothetical protein [Flavobacterium sp.]
MKKLIMLLFTVSIAAIATAQNTYQPGYYITNSGNRIDCLILNIAWKNSPIEFQFKMSENEQPVTADIKTVKEFSVDNAYKFKRFTTKMERSASDVNKLDREAQAQWKEETIFLNVLVEGNATLYKYEDGNMIKYFFSTGNHETAEQLLHKEYVVNGVIMKNSTYKQQLYNLMKDKITSTNTFERLQYKKTPLVDLFVEYNGDANSKNLTAKQNKGSVNLKVKAGAGLAMLTTENVVNNYAMDFDSKVVFRIGAEVEYILPFNNNKWSLFIDPYYSTYSADGNNGATSYSAEYNSVSLPVGARHYFYITNDSKIFVNAMISFDFVVGDAAIKYNLNKLDIEKTSHFAAGAGYATGNLSAEIRYDFSRGLLNRYQFWASEYESFGLILGYKFL